MRNVGLDAETQTDKNAHKKIFEIVKAKNRIVITRDNQAFKKSCD